MTNPRVVIERRLIDGKWTDILDVEATKELRNRKPLSNEEIEETLREADNIKEELQLPETRRLLFPFRVLFSPFSIYA
jgi:hypothetical protein